VGSKITTQFILSNYRYREVHQFFLSPLYSRGFDKKNDAIIPTPYRHTIYAVRRRFIRTGFGIWIEGDWIWLPMVARLLN
jgi:hypothetical protein